VLAAPVSRFRLVGLGLPLVGDLLVLPLPWVLLRLLAVVLAQPTMDSVVGKPLQARPAVFQGLRALILVLIILSVCEGDMTEAC